MQNGDCPASPLSGNAYDDFAVHCDHPNSSYNPKCQGLTKREHFAGLIVQALVSNPKLEAVNDSFIASTAVEMADELLRAIGRKAF